jgi:type VI protein secretion system component Hcp
MTRISKGFVVIGAVAAFAFSASGASAGMHAVQGTSNIGSGSGAGKAVQSFQINKQADSASPKLYMLHNGTHTPKMTVYDKHKDW